ncbi:hypothetical protein [Polaribacter sp. SA4-12]|uniref:hypothetical protein n=1 Tax=Polaribacter sp. SA4-12 TaxID=1312072 RepID=UPI000B3C1569|nr:hypothetical protein [Polaribacter sp. SA4-12]ARV15802.1 hypothetical protein BTO07_11930 [Polaribacter sp. SA4-12]
MKKLILSLVFVFATGTMMNANSTNEIIITPTTETVEIIEDFGCASDCVRSSKAIVFQEAAEEGRGASMDDYMLEYGYCYYSNCVD